MLAAVMCAFVNEKEFDDDLMAKRLLPPVLTREFLKLRKGLTPFAGRLITSGFKAPNLFLQPAATMFSWAAGEPWENVVQRSPFAEGDLARLILRTAENLRQLTGLGSNFPQVASISLESIDMILKDPVITFHD